VGKKEGLPVIRAERAGRQSQIDASRGRGCCKAVKVQEDSLEGQRPCLVLGGSTFHVQYGAFRGNRGLASLVDRRYNNISARASHVVRFGRVAGRYNNSIGDLGGWLPTLVEHPPERAASFDGRAKHEKTQSARNHL
jgi:hypothetical protein